MPEHIRCPYCRVPIRIPHYTTLVIHLACQVVLRKLPEGGWEFVDGELDDRARVAIAR